MSHFILRADVRDSRSAVARAGAGDRLGAMSETSLYTAEADVEAVGVRTAEGAALCGRVETSAIFETAIDHELATRSRLRFELPHEAALLAELVPARASDEQRERALQAIRKVLAW